ncbi:MAG: pantoate--beta-alanine ligase [Nitrospirae bacterium]|nr:pantoate--beta-alanine ligase [Nitrospirota bacterium]
MKIIRSPQSMAAWSERLRREGLTIGFVPTMGALHDGHRALIRAARLQCDALVVSIFVNPTQFGPTEDLAKYPRPIAADRTLCREEGVDVCFEPTADTMYPEGFQTMVTVPEIAQRWEGVARPHHFAGVATVVTKLFGIVRPHLALFGQKDYQQAMAVKRLVTDLNLGVTIDVRPTIREQDGLAMSSRNRYLSPENRQAATILYQALQAGRRAIQAGRRHASMVERIMRQTVEQEPAALIEYFALCDPASLAPLTHITGRVLLLGAIKIGTVRLLDNVVVPASHQVRRAAK